MQNSCAELSRLIISEQVDPNIFVNGLRWWIEVREKHGRLPQRADFRPEELPADTLPHVLLIDVGATPEEMRFRLVGTAHVEFNQSDHTGKRFSEIYDKNSASLPYVMSLYAELIRTKRPIWSVNELHHSKTQRILKICRLMLPFSNKENEISLCMAIQKNFYSDVLLEDSDILWRTAKDPRERVRQIL